MPKNVSLLIVPLLSFLVFAGCASSSSGHFSDSSDSLFNDPKSYTVLKNKSSQPDTFQIKGTIQLTLDSASSIKVMDSLKDGTQLLLIDGEGQLNISQNATPAILYTGMMKLSFREAEFHVNAYGNSPGQSLKVFKGQLIATKSYTSDFPNTDTLHPGEMILINRDIDLMEKETFDLPPRLQ